MATVKRILIYLKGNVHYGLWYPKSNNFTLREFTDVDWEGSIDDRKSTSGAAFYLGDCLVLWLSKKESSISLSTAEAVYCCCIMLYTSHLDEANIGRFNCKI